MARKVVMKMTCENRTGPALALVIAGLRNLAQLLERRRIIVRVKGRDRGP